MLEALRRLILTLDVQVQQRTQSDEMGRVATDKADEGDVLSDRVRAIAAQAIWMQEQADALADPKLLMNAGNARFDALDVRAWVSLAEAAGVPHVSAVEIATLSDDEVVALLHKLEQILVSPLGKHLQSGLDGMDPRARFALAALFDPEESADPDVEALGGRLYAAMDAVPEGWMVRHARAGAASLKVLAGKGLPGVSSPETRIGSGVEVGPGWLRNGDRRRIDVGDLRVLGAAVGTRLGRGAFVARPWIEAGRLLADPDTSRRDAPFPGKGAWPAEWRVFVENGRVVGVSAYYAWAGGLGAEDAAAALEAAGLAQRVVDAAAERGLVPFWNPLEITRGNADDDSQALSDRLPRDGIHCTLDFMETREGLVLLEGGAPFTPRGGGFPCAFAGTGWPQGIALRSLEGVSLADPSTWQDGDRTGRILSWEEARELATGHRSSPAS